MLEALVSLRRTRGESTIAGAEHDLKKCGDIIVVKKSPAVWGTDEKKFFLIVYLEDAALEARVDAAGGLLVHPFAKFDDKTKVMTSRSEYRVNIDALKVLNLPNLDPADVTETPYKPPAKEAFKLTDLTKIAAVAIP